MDHILYTYKNQVYANITNRCDCQCRFCIRSHEDAVGDAETLWHQKDPTLEEIKTAMDEFDFTDYTELVYCGYGEPTCALDNLIESAKYVKEKYMDVTRPQFENAFEGMLDFARECRKSIPQVKMTVVDVLPQEEIEESKKLARTLGVELRVRKFA